MPAGFDRRANLRLFANSHCSTSQNDEPQNPVRDFRVSHI